MTDELEVEGGLMSSLVATLDKTTETRDTILQEFVQANALLERVGPVLKQMYKTAAEKDFDVNATNYAVQVALNAGYRKALKDVHRILYPEVTTK